MLLENNRVFGLPVTHSSAWEQQGVWGASDTALLENNGVFWGASDSQLCMRATGCLGCQWLTALLENNRVFGVLGTHSPAWEQQGVWGASDSQLCLRTTGYLGCQWLTALLENNRVFGVPVTHSSAWEQQGVWGASDSQLCLRTTGCLGCQWLTALLENNRVFGVPVTTHSYLWEKNPLLHWGTQTHISIVPGFSARRSTNWVTPASVQVTGI